MAFLLSSDPHPGAKFKTPLPLVSSLKCGMQVEWHLLRMDYLSSTVYLGCTLSPHWNSPIVLGYCEGWKVDRISHLKHSVFSKRPVNDLE